ncbi:hypothetical protein B0O80DRAFT_473302 [Mortierella sp. GBAus27b]|nr:hypothetical protein B0O80DRAFT_473302 [Mortierella sp. GBAus27b]
MYRHIGIGNPGHVHQHGCQSRSTHQHCQQHPPSPWLYLTDHAPCGSTLETSNTVV